MNHYHSSILSAPAGDTGSSGAPQGGVLAEAKETLSATASKVKAAAADTAVRAKEQAERVVTEKKDTAAERIGGYSSAIHDTARSLEEKDPNIAWFTHRAADRLQNIADYVREHRFSDLRHDAEDLARRHPAAFFGGMFLAGLVLGNVVKASQRKAASSEHDPEPANEPDWSARTNEGEPATLTDAERAAAGI